MTVGPISTRATTSANVFLCYATADEATARRLASYMRASGITVRLGNDAPPGDSIGEYVWTGIMGAQTVVVLLSEAAEQSPWVSVELATALANRDSDPTKRVIPILLGRDAVLPPLLVDTKAIHVDDDSQFEERAELLVQIVEHPSDLSKRTPQSSDLMAARETQLRIDIREAEVTERLATLGLIGLVTWILSISVAIAVLVGVVLSASYFAHDSHKFDILGITFLGGLISNGIWVLILRTPRFRDAIIARERSRRERHD